MSFKNFLTEDTNKSTGNIELTDELKAQITKELHNGYFGAEHRHAIKIRKIESDKYYVLVGHHVDEHQVSMSNLKLKVGDEIFEVFEFESIDLHNVKSSDIMHGPDGCGIFTNKEEALKYFNSLS